MRGREGALRVSVERAVDEDQGDGQRGASDDDRQGGAVLAQLGGSSTASRPKRVVNLITGFMATDEVSLNGSPDGVAHDGGRVELGAPWP